MSANETIAPTRTPPSEPEAHPDEQTPAEKAAETRARHKHEAERAEKKAAKTDAQAAGAVVCPFCGEMIAASPALQTGVPDRCPACNREVLTTQWGSPP